MAPTLTSAVSWNDNALSKLSHVSKDTIKCPHFNSDEWNPAAKIACR
jgi:hypothetical protein